MAQVLSFTNTAAVTFLGSPVNSNTVAVYGQIPPTITKAADKTYAQSGDTVTYTIVITNPSAIAMAALPFSDVIEPGSTYVADSFTVNGAPASATLVGNTLTATLPDIAASEAAIITFQVTATFTS